MFLGDISDEVIQRLWDGSLGSFSKESFDFITGMSMIKSASYRWFAEAIDGGAARLSISAKVESIRATSMVSGPGAIAVLSAWTKM